jgi:hypothetical protein
MSKRVISGTMLFFLIFLGTSILLSCKAESSSVPLVYVDPPTIVGTTVGQEINVTVMVKDFTNLYLWQVGLMWNPSILEGLAIYADATLPDDVFDVLAPGTGTLCIAGSFDNTKGTLGYSAQGLKAVQYGVNATAGESYKLMKVKFRVKAMGTSDIHLSDVMLINACIARMPVQILDVYTVKDDYTYTVKILTNSTGTTRTNIFGHQFLPESKALRFNLTSIATRDYAPKGSNGFCNVTIPRGLM